MADPYRLTVLKRMTTLLETMTVAGGYPYDLAGRVHRGRTIYGEEVDVPFVTILEAPRPGFNIYGGDREVTSNVWDLLLQGFCDDDVKHPADPLYVFAEAVQNVLSVTVLEKNDGSGRPMFPEWYHLGRNDEGAPLVASFEFGPAVVRPPEGTPTKRICFYMPVRVGLAGEVGTPSQ